jgi:hypothetical protein
MDAYLFVHFREKKTPDGEQVYFALSKDGLIWETVNEGKPVLWSKLSEQGVRDHTIVRTADNKFYIIATDLSLASNFKTKYESDWKKVSRQGSRYLSLWQSDDLVNWSGQRLIQLGGEDFGCRWAPDVIYDRKNDDYVIHWSSINTQDEYSRMAIYYSRTKDFEHFTEAELLYGKDDSGVIDSAIYENDGIYYLFAKSDNNPNSVIMLKSDSITGKYVKMDAFDEAMSKLSANFYEAPTAYKLSDGRWCLMIDFFGVEGDGQGYVPFISDDISTGEFVRSSQSFDFPYGFKHGTVLKITMDEFDRIKEHKFC